MNSIEYKSGYKYQLHSDYTVQIDIYPACYIKTAYINLTVSGMLDIKAGYAWDGPSGPAIDTLDFMRGSLVHDALYQLMRMGKINAVTWRKEADLELKRICIQDGMPRIRAWSVYFGVYLFGWSATLPENVKPVLRAPR